MKNFRQDTLFTKQLQLLHSDWFASRTTGGLSVWVWESCSTTMEAKSNRSNLTKCPRLIILRLLGFTTACPSGLQQVIACKVVACPSLAGRRSAQGYQRPVQREATKYNFRRSSGSRRRSRAPSSPVALLIQVVHSGNRKVQWPESHALGQSFPGVLVSLFLKGFLHLRRQLSNSRTPGVPHRPQTQYVPLPSPVPALPRLRLRPPEFRPRPS